MRFALISTSLLLLPALAVARPLPALDTTNIPQACHELARAPASAQIPGPSLSARISVANCLITERTRGLELRDDAASITALQRAVEPSLALLDEVIANGDPAHQILAHHARADLLSGLQVRMRSAIPPVDTMTYAAHEARRDALEPQIAAWGAEANASFEQVAALAEANPQAATANPVIEYATRRADAAVGQVATR